MQRSEEIEAALERVRSSTDPGQIRKLVEGARSEALSFRPAAGEWSVVEILRHLGDTEEVRHTRFDRMLAEDNPIMDRPRTLPPGERDSEDALLLLARYERFRAVALERLSVMTEEQWRRVGTQLPDPQVNRTVPSPTSVLNESQKILRHSADHLDQTRENLAAFRRQSAARR